MIPITSVVLYKHGVASIERRGQVRGDQSLNLVFKPEEMNDVLKSLTVVDQSGKGQIASISYDNDQPVSIRLENTNLELSEMGNNIISFLNQIKGARLTVTSPGGAQDSGLVMGITNTAFLTKEGARHPISQLDLLCDDSRITSVMLTPETRFHLDDESLRRNLNTHLGILSAGKKQDRKSVTIFAKGQGERALSVSYTIKAPMWKVSYRIVLNPKGLEKRPAPEEKAESAPAKKSKTDEVKEKEKEEVLIQAWAIVDNISDEKWTDVSLTLMAGEPHSVDCDLFTPAMQGTHLAPAVVHSAPQHSISQLKQQLPMNRMPQRNMMPQMQQMQQMQQMMPQQPSQMMPQQMLSNYASMTPAPPPSAPVAAKVETEEVGDLFKYELANPVTVNPNQSALVPIAITRSIGSRVAVFQDDKHSGHPNTAVMLINTTGLTFERGPVTVLDGTLYVGEAMLETLKPGETRFVEFSTEMSVDIWSTEERSEQVTRTTISGGTLTLHSRVIHRKIYKLRSKSSRDVMIYLHHKFRKDCKLLLSETKEQTNPVPINYYIFDVTSPASKTVEFKVSESCAGATSQRLTSNADGSYDSWFRLKYIDSKTNGILQKAAALSARIRDCSQGITQAEQKISSIGNNQARLRDNLRCLSSSPDEVNLRKKYIADLSADEAVLEGAKQSIVQLNATRDSLTKEREHLIDSIELDHNVQ